jgi:predicted porin
MKKTLVALAVLAASGASFAQVALTGQIGYGYQASTDKTGANAGGLGLSDSNLVFTASEDLGGGTKVTAQLKLDGISRKAVTGGDEFVSLSGGFGTLTMGLAEYDVDLPDQFGTFMGGTTLGGRNNYNDSERRADFAKYSNTFGAFGVSVQHMESELNQGIGSGAAGSSNQRLNTIGASYTAGPLSVKGDYSAYDNKSSVAAGVTSYDNRTTLGGNYDLGVVKLGLGFQSTKYAVQGSALDSFVGATIPFGALALGIDYMNTKWTDTGTDGTSTSWGVQGVYSLSKLTNIRVRYASYDDVMNPTNKSSYTQVALYKNF